VIQINLLPKEERIEEPRLNLRMPRARIWIPAALVLVVLLPLGGIHAMQRSRIASLRADIAQAEVELRTLRPQVERINQLTQEREQLNLRLSVIQGLSRDRYIGVELMDHLADQVPDYLWLTKADETGAGQITIEGLAFSNLMVAELMSRMERSDFFNNVALTVAERAKTGLSADHALLSFTVTARIKP
jgi:type IV pilus assembly protein PilN